MVAWSLKCNIWSFIFHEPDILIIKNFNITICKNFIGLIGKKKKVKFRISKNS